MNYRQGVKYTHLLLISPLLFYIGDKGLYKEKIHKYIYVFLIILAIKSIIVHSRLIYEKFKFSKSNENANGYDSIFSTGKIDRRYKKWFIQREHNIDIIDNEFVPQFINVMKGDTIIWTNRDNTSHEINSYTGILNSNELKKDESYKYTFNNQGVFNYFCDKHPYSTGSVSVVTAGYHPNVQDIDNKWN